MNNLPVELHAEIFRHLDVKERKNARFVCRNWNDIILSHPAVSRDLVVSFDQVLLNPNTTPLRYFLGGPLQCKKMRLGPHVEFAQGSPINWQPFVSQTTELEVCLTDRYPQLSRLVDAMPSLRKLRMPNEFLCLKLLQTLVSTSSLEFLQFGFLVRHEPLQQILQLCPNLRRVKIENHVYTEADFRDVLRQIVEMLRAFPLVTVDVVVPVSVQPLTQWYSKEVTSETPYMEAFQISRPETRRIHFRSVFFCSLVLQPVSLAFRNLKEVVITSFLQCYINTVVELPSVETLILDAPFKYVCSHCLRMLLRCFPKVSFLKVVAHDMTCESLVVFAQEMPRELRRLSLNITTHEFNEIELLFGGLSVASLTDLKVDVISYGSLHLLYLTFLKFPNVKRLSLVLRDFCNELKDMVELGLTLWPDLEDLILLHHQLSLRNQRTLFSTHFLRILEKGLGKSLKRLEVPWIMGPREVQFKIMREYPGLHNFKARANGYRAPSCYQMFEDLTAFKD